MVGFAPDNEFESPGAESLHSTRYLCFSPGAWVITGGSHTGVMKQVGEAVRDFSLSGSFCEGEVVTIGIATWGALHNRESLIHPMVSWRLLWAGSRSTAGRWCGRILASAQ